ncbi:MAG: hypothetical protein HC905_16510 [Bacteroidales bacterium]|nr:hypothetical protein [Bacteroidales bacterium]
MQVHNDAATSSDLTGIIYLSAGIVNESLYFQPTPSWFQPPVETGSSNLPIVHINTNGRAIDDEPKIPGILSVMYKGVGAENNLTDTPILECRIGIETRGSSSQMFPKKSFGFETRTALDSNLNVSILGLPVENDWILYAPYDDKTFLRDILAYRLGNLMGHYTPRFVMCELYLNNQYWAFMC